MHGPTLFPPERLPQSAARRAWDRGMKNAVNQICLERKEFTSDEIYFRARANGVLIHAWSVDGRRFGLVMRRAVRVGWCQKANLPPRNTKRKNHHANPKQVWVSRIWHNPELRGDKL